MNLPSILASCFVTFVFLSISARAQDTPQPTATAAPISVATGAQPPDFVALFTFSRGGYKNTVSLKTVGSNRTLRMEGERCFVEGVFSVEDSLGGQPSTWVLPGVTNARSSADEKFCESGKSVPILVQKEVKKSFLGASYRSAEFKWGSFSGTFELK